MEKYIGILILAKFFVLAYCEMRLPPSITKQNEENEVFLAIDSPFTLICEASGFPDPQYEWYLNGIPANFKPDEIERAQGVGTITIKALSYTNIGLYHCMASNKYGKTRTKKINVVVAFIAKFPPEIPQVITKTAGEKLKLTCDLPKSAPKPTISWRSVISVEKPPDSNIIPLNRRVQIDDHGNLVFAYVIPSDHINNWYYQCNVENTLAGQAAFGSSVKLTVLPNSNPINEKPAIESYTGEKVQGGIVMALKRKSISLRCLFSGKPEPVVTWKRADNKPLPHERIDYEFLQTVLIIKNVEDYDEATYICEGTNVEGSATHQIIMNVEAIPKYVNSTAKPVNKNATDGEDVTFMCDPEAEPAASITWYMNNEVLDVATLPPRVTIDADKKKLHISKVCKDCKSGDSDLKVYACEAVNKHGSTFSSGYLNVLMPTMSTTKPADVVLTKYDIGNVTFACFGTTDELTPLKSLWYFNGVLLDDVPGEIFVRHTAQGSVLNVVAPADRIEGYLGRYTCLLTNGYSSVNASADLVADPKDLPATTTAGLLDIWWVFLIAFLLLLLLLLLVCCCMYYKRNKGGEYDVDEKERKAGFDPEVEMVRDGCEEYQRPEVNKIKGSRASLCSTQPLERDDESLSEGDLCFNEDGSFIGRYNTTERKTNF